MKMSYFSVRLFSKYNLKFWRYLTGQWKLLQLAPEAGGIPEVADISAFVESESAHTDVFSYA